MNLNLYVMETIKQFFRNNRVSAGTVAAIHSAIMKELERDATDEINEFLKSIKCRTVSRNEIEAWHKKTHMSQLEANELLATPL